MYVFPRDNVVHYRPFSNRPSDLTGIFVNFYLCLTTYAYYMRTRSHHWIFLLSYYLFSLLLFSPTRAPSFLASIRPRLQPVFSPPPELPCVLYHCPVVRRQTDTYNDHSPSHGKIPLSPHFIYVRVPLFFFDVLHFIRPRGIYIGFSRNSVHIHFIFLAS